jgi:trehalose-6-phosphate synthase
MGPDERRDRMSRMQSVVEENNVYRWAANLLEGLLAARTGQQSWRNDAAHEDPAHHLANYVAPPGAAS